MCTFMIDNVYIIKRCLLALLNESIVSFHQFAGVRRQRISTATDRRVSLHSKTKQIWVRKT